MTKQMLLPVEPSERTPAPGIPAPGFPARQAAASGARASRTPVARRSVSRPSDSRPFATPGGDPGIEDDPNDFHIDAHTREIGRVGIAAARQALAEAVKRAAAREPELAA